MNRFLVSTAALKFPQNPMLAPIAAGRTIPAHKVKFMLP